jgi:hypothetical protein
MRVNVGTHLVARMLTTGSVSVPPSISAASASATRESTTSAAGALVPLGSGYPTGEDRRRDRYAWCRERGTASAS